MYSKLGRLITNEEFDFRIKDSNFIRASDYINSTTSIKFSCKDCNKIFHVKPKEFNRLKCSCINRENSYKESIKNRNIVLLDKYVNIQTKVNHQCLDCSLIFKTSPKVLKTSKNGCPSCSGKIFSIEKYKSLLPNDIEFISPEYKGSCYKHLHQCKICNLIWDTKPNYIIHMGCGCPECALSKGEKEISNYLKEKNIQFIRQHIVKIDNTNYRFDFYLPDLDIYIEYDGIQHYQPVDYFGGEEAYQKILINDQIKNNWILENKFKLFRISYNQNILKILNSINI